MGNQEGICQIVRQVKTHSLPRFFGGRASLLTKAVRLNRNKLKSNSNENTYQNDRNTNNDYTINH